MFYVRIVGAGAISAAFIALTVTSVAAQTSSAPLPLLQFVQHDKAAPSHPRPKAGASVARKKPTGRHIAKHKVAKRHRTIVAAGRATRSAPVATPTAAAAAPKNNWPTPNAAMQSVTAQAIATPPGNPTLAAPAPTNAVATAPVIDTDPNEIMGNAHAVEVNLPVPAAPTNVAAGARQGAIKTAQAAGSGSAAAAAAPIPVVRAMVARSPVGSTSWIEHVLAALGGAIAAGVLAWFLIGPAPERTYG